MSAGSSRSNSVEIRARVSGYLDKVHFKDGEIVKQGDLLFTIDRRPFQNALEQARANLAQAKANLAFTEADLQRAQSLVRERTITEQLFDQRTQANRTAQAQVAAQEAAVKQAELDLQFTELRAPITGRIGDRRVSPGNLVTGGTHRHDVAARHHRVDRPDPLRVHLRRGVVPALRARSPSCCPIQAEAWSPTVALKLLDEKEFTHKGKMDFVDNVIDRSSGTIRGRAQFSNPEVAVHARHVRAGAGAGLAALSRRCWCLTRRSAPTRAASSCSSSNADNTATAEIRDARQC